MTANPKNRRPTVRRKRSGILATSIAALLALGFAPSAARGQTWLQNSTTGNWNTAANWNPATVPNSASAAATFGLSNTTNVSLSANTTIGTITFNADGYVIGGASSLILAGTPPTIDVANPGDSATISAKLTGAAGLIANGGGTLILANASDTYTGGTVITNGVVQVGTATAAGSIGGGGVVVGNGGDFTLINVSGATFTASITNGVNGVGNLDVASTKTNTLSGLLSDGTMGQLAITQSGTGTTILTDAGDHYTGTMTISKGVLEIGTTTQVGALSVGGSISVGTGGALLLSKVFVPGFSNNISNGIGGTGLVNVALATGPTLSGVLSDGVGSLAFTQSGTGTTILSGADTYTGATNVTAGTLQIGNGTTGNLTGATVVTVSGKGILALDLNGGSTFARNVNLSATGTAFAAVQANYNTLSGVISGLGAFDQNGTGVTVLNQTETYTGATNVNAGTLEVDGSLAAASTVNVGTGGMLTGTATIHGKATLTGNGAINLGTGATIAGTLAVTGGTWAGPGTVNGLVTSSSGAFTISGALTAPSGLAVTGGMLAGTGTIVGNLNYTSTASSSFGGNISGSTVNMNKAGATLAVSGLTTGTVNVLAGTFQVAGGLAAADAVTVSGTGALAVDQPDGSSFFNNVSLSGAGAALKAVQAGANTLSGVIGGMGAFDQNGTGTTVLTKTETYTGMTNVNAGTLEIDGSLAAASTVNVGDAGQLTGAGAISGKATLTGNGIIDLGTMGNIAGTLAVTGGNWNGQGTVGGIVTSGSGAFNIGSGASLSASAGLNVTGGTLTGTGNLAGSLNYTSGSSSTFGGVLAGSGTTLTMNKAGATLTLNGANTYTGATTVSAGTLQVGDGTSGSLAGASIVTVTGTGTLLMDLADSSTFSNTANLNGSGTALKAIQSGTNTFSGVISGTGVFDQNGTGTTILNNTETYTGSTNVNAGLLEVDGSLASGSTVNMNGGELIGQGTINGKVTLTGSGSIGLGTGGNIVGPLTVSGGRWFGGTVNGLVTVSSGNFGIINALTAPAGLDVTGGTISGGGTITGSLNYASSSSSTFYGSIGGVNSTLTLNKSGGILTLLTASNYGGPTTINAGTLLADNTSNSATGASDVLVNNGGALGGSGTVSGPVFINSGGTLTHANTNTPATLTVGSLVLNSGAKLDYNLGVTGGSGVGVSDLTVVNGDLTLAGTLNIAGLFGFGAGTYELFSYSGTLLGSTLKFGTLPAGFNASHFAIQTSTVGQVDLVVTGGPAVQYWNGTVTGGGATGGPGGGVVGGSGTWDNVTTNWTDATGFTNAKWGQLIAVFSTGSGTVTLGDNITVPSFGFVPGSGSYTINVVPSDTLTISGAGVTNTSGTTQTLTTAVNPSSHVIGIISFLNKATAGNLVIVNNGGSTEFKNSSTAGTATITNSASASASINAGITNFHNTSTAGSSAIFNQGATVSGAFGGSTTFEDTSSAGGEIYNLAASVSGAHSGFTTFTDKSAADNSLVIQNIGATVSGAAGGYTVFAGSSTAGNAYITVGGGSNGGLGGGIYFTGTSDGGTAEVNSSGNGFMDISALTSTGMKIGSINGVGLFYLGSKSLTFGGNNSFGDPGVIADGGSNGGTGGSIVKTGTGTYFLTGADTYTGATTVSAGTLEIGNGTVGGLASVSAVKVAANATLALDLPDGATFSNSVANAGHVLADESTSNNYTIAGTISGSGNLTKIQTNTVAVIGANTYSGGTVVNGGILTANNPAGSATGTGPVTINSSGTFGGSGKITGAMTLNNGGTVAPGAAFSGTPGATLHGSSLTWNGGGAITLQLGASANDALALTGALTKGSTGTYTLDLINAGLVSTDTYNLTLLTFASTTFAQANFTLELPMNYTGVLVETSTNLMIENLMDPTHMDSPAVQGADFAVTDSTDTSQDTPSNLTVTPTPEPGSATLLALGTAALLGWRRRRTRSERIARRSGGLEAPSLSRGSGRDC